LVLINIENKFEYFEVDYTGKIERNECDKEYYFGQGNIVELFYNENYQKMILGAEKGEVYTLAIPAEKIEDEEEGDEEDQNDRNKEKVIDVEPVICGSFHNGPVTFLTELNENSAFLSAGYDGKLFIWDSKTSKMISKIEMDCHFTCGDIDIQGRFVI